MRGVLVFSGSSHPTLTEAICERLGTSSAKCELKKFSNGETSVEIGESVRNKDVFIVQSGSPKINDSVMELLIMIAACKGGSAQSITAVMPYFPYSRQSKKKSHRGAITARMLANLLSVAGVNHVITVDLHASQMQGFFGKPVDNLFAEPLIARWIKSNIPGWKEAVVVSKNAGGTKRVTSLADTLKLNFGIVTTDRMRPSTNSAMMESSLFFESLGGAPLHRNPDNDEYEVREITKSTPQRSRSQMNGTADAVSPRRPPNPTMSSSPLVHTTQVESTSPPPAQIRLSRVTTAPTPRPSEDETVDEYTDERAREVITGRLIHGHIVDDDHPSPALSAMSASLSAFPADRQSQDIHEIQTFDPMTSSFMSTVSSTHPDHALGGTFDATASSDEEEEGLKHPEGQTITLVGNVKDKTVLLMDDMIDKSGSWIAAAETVVKRGGAKKVYCIGTHGLLGDNSLEELDECECIDYIVITNTFPIPASRRESKKLVVIDVAHLLSEAIRRNHHGESISALFHLYD